MDLVEAGLGIHRPAWPPLAPPGRRVLQVGGARLLHRVGGAPGCDLPSRRDARPGSARRISHPPAPPSGGAGDRLIDRTVGGGANRPGRIQHLAPGRLGPGHRIGGGCGFHRSDGGGVPSLHGCHLGLAPQPQGP